MKLNATIVNEVIFLALIGILGFMFLNLFTPFLPIIFISIIIVIFFHPVYKFILKFLKNKVLSSILTSIIVIISLLIPITLIFAVAASQANDVTDEIIEVATSDGVLSDDAKVQIRELIDEAFRKLGIRPSENQGAQITIDLKSLISNSAVLSQLVELLPIVLSTISILADVMFKGFILLFLTIFLFIEYEHLPQYVRRYSPLQNNIDTLLFNKFVLTIRTIIKGSFFVALIQATLILLPMIFFEVPGTAIWWIIMFILSIVPVGAGAVSIPIGLFMIVSPEYTPLQGIFLIIYSVISINIVDSLVRPQLTKDGTGLHPLMIFLSGIGGIIVFASPLGLIYGQLIAVFYKTVIHVYQEKYNEANEPKESK